MGTIIGGKFFDDAAVQFNGVDQLAYLDSPPWMGDTQGAWAFDVTLLSFPAGTGNANRYVNSCGLYLRTGLFNIRFWRDTGFGDTGIHFGVLFNPTGVAGNNQSAGAATALSVGITYRIVVGSDRKIYINGSSQSIVAFSGLPWTSGWYGSLSGPASNYAQVIAGSKLPGSAPTAYGNVRLNNMHYINRPLTATEVTEDYNGGIRKAWQKMSFAADILHAYDFESNFNDQIGAAHFTPVNGPQFVAP